MLSAASEAKKRAILEALGIEDQNDYNLRQAIQQRLSSGMDEDMSKLLVDIGNMLSRVGRGLPADKSILRLKETIEEMQ